MKNKNKKQYYYVGGMVGLTVSAVALLSTTASANTANVHTVSTTVPPSCSFTSASTSSYSATILNGQTSTITADPITATCNDTSGYAIYAIGYSGDTYDGDYHTDMISTLSNSYNIKTNGTNGSSYWKMKLQDLSNATIANSYDNFQTIPASLTKIASYTSDIAVASLTPVYQVYIDTTQLADTYTGKVKYTLVHPSTMVAGTYNVAYDANGGTGTMTGSNGLYNFEEFTMPTSSFTAPSGYAFAGWCTTNTAGSYACDGTSYAAGDAVTSFAPAGNTVTLYAYWEEVPRLYMQDMTLSQCQVNVGTNGNIANVGDEITVYDRRSSNYSSGDDGSYTVRYIYGSCWMTQNLRITGTINKQYSNFNTYDDVNVCESNSNGSYDEATCHDSGNTSDGVWYNYAAASAKTVVSSNNSNVATEDICPAGWHLPNINSFNTLVTNTSTVTGNHLFSPVNGGIREGGANTHVGEGYWWSSSSSSSETYRNNLTYNSSTVKFSLTSLNRLNSSYIRCVR